MRAVDLISYSLLLGAVFLGLGLGIGHWIGYRKGLQIGERDAMKNLLQERLRLERRKAQIDRALAPHSSTRAAVIAPTASIRSQAQVDDKSR